MQGLVVLAVLRSRSESENESESGNTKPVVRIRGQDTFLIAADSSSYLDVAIRSARLRGVVALAEPDHSPHYLLSKHTRSSS